MIFLIFSRRRYNPADPHDRRVMDVIALVVGITVIIGAIRWILGI